MACSVNLFTYMDGGPTAGGQWTFTDTTNPSSDLFANVDMGGDTTYSFGAVIGTNHTPMVDFTNSVDADYTFTYTTGVGGSCQDEATLVVTVVNGVTAGVDFGPLTVCNTDPATEYTLFWFLDGGTGLVSGGGLVTTPGGTVTGAWSGNGIGTTGTSTVDTGSIPIGYQDQGTPSDPSDDTFIPFQISPGTYNFIYTVDQTAGADACDDCEDTKTITLEVSGAPFAGDDSMATVCSSPA